MNKLFLGAVALSLAMISCTKSSTEKKKMLIPVPTLQLIIYPVPQKLSLILRM